MKNTIKIAENEASEEFGTLAGQSQRYRGAERVPDQPRGHEPEALHQVREVTDVLADTARSGGRSLWLCPRRWWTGPETTRPGAERPRSQSVWESQDPCTRTRGIIPLSLSS
jgi:hypothetical protein